MARESGWSSFAEKEVKCMVDRLLSIVYKERLVSDIGRACLIEIGYTSRWWERCNHVCEKSVGAGKFAMASDY